MTGLSAVIVTVCCHCGVNIPTTFECLLDEVFIYSIVLVDRINSHGGLRFPVVLDRLSNQPPDFTGPQLERLRCEETTLTATFSGHYGK
ncbi:unnamed protein product [Toxocara canis]|uniref:Secreted protein n=1 Tax=Toxocara canis TaxID=6265 RepID=A0A183UHH7_TOXCA|nr:unnamed protein product [Toxocara canis]